MDAATRLCDAYIPHGLQILNIIRGHGDNLTHARDVLEHLRRHGKATFKQSDIYRAFHKSPWLRDAKGKGARNELIGEELETLIDYGHIRPLPLPEDTKPGNKPSPRFEIHPIHLDDGQR